MDWIFITLIGIGVGYYIARNMIKSAMTIIIIGCVLYLLFTQKIEGGEPIIKQIRSAF